MGLTHSWERDAELDPRAFVLASTDSRTLLDHLKIPLANVDGTGQPVLTIDTIAFNGQSGSSCEPFEIHSTEFDRHHGRHRFFQFTKTNAAPYDFCVRAVLICLKHHLGAGIDVLSDSPENEWQQVKESCQEILGYGLDFRLKR